MADTKSYIHDWEFHTQRELGEEYDRVVWAHRAPMKRPLILLVDSEKFWGRWNSFSRTIEISRNLVRNHSWFQVTAILKHEMAHQYVDEVMGQGHGPSPHGELFQLACRKLGVPDEYSGASINLQSENLDRRTLAHDEKSERLLERVRKLLSLATSSNEHEAALAMNRVREIYAKYNLEAASKPGFHHSVISIGSRRVELFEKKIANLLVAHFFVEVIIGSEFDVQTGNTNRTLELIGKRENVLMAEYVYHFLKDQSIRLVNLHPATDRRARRSYRLGILDGFQEKLREAERPPAANESNPVHGALVVFKKDRELGHYIKTVFPRLRSSRSSGSPIDMASYSAGTEDGGRITLNKPIHSKQGNLGRLLR